jgi:CBS domain-containing protein
MDTIPDSLLHATILQLSKHAPFDQMEQAHLGFMVRRLRLAYYPQGTAVLEPAQGNVQRFYIIKQGSVTGKQAGDETAHWQLVEGECFPLGALLAKRPVTSVYRAVEDTFCYELSADDFTELLRISPPFQDFCTRRIANLLEQSQRVLQARYSNQRSAQQSLATPLSTLIRRSPVTCPPHTPIKDALRTMQQERVGSIIIAESHHPIGIFTLHDLLNRVALTNADTNQAISTVMSSAPLTLPAHALAHDAALAMTRHSVRHILVMDKDKLAGMISEKDLFSLQRVGLSEISAAIHAAPSVESLQQCGRDIHTLGYNMLAQGMSAEHLTQIITALNDQLVTRVIELEMSSAGLADLAFCWVALGSEGRQEQTFSTDQDNAIIIADTQNTPADTLRQTLLPLALRINQALDQCGFPLCQGQIMASNPRWCLTLSEWKNQFASWMHRGDPPVLLNASIFFDFRPIYGDASLAAELRRWLNDSIKQNRLFLRHMTENALANRPPLGLVQDFNVSDKDGHPHSIDLKINGITPFVDAARIFSLGAGIAETNTIRRLRQIGEQWQLNKSQVDGWAEAFTFIQLLRLRQHHEQTQSKLPPSNRIDPDKLNDLDRRILKEAFRQARKLQVFLGETHQF